MSLKKKTTSKKTAQKPVEKAPKASAKKVASKVTPEQRQRMIEEAAYYIAEREGFRGDPHSCWVRAEAQISALLAGKK